MSELPDNVKAEIAAAVRIVQSDRDPETARRSKLKAAGLSDEEIAHLGTYKAPGSEDGDPPKDGDPTPPPPKDPANDPAPKKKRAWWGDRIDDEPEGAA